MHCKSAMPCKCIHTSTLHSKTILLYFTCKIKQQTAGKSVVRDASAGLDAEKCGVQIYQFTLCQHFVEPHLVEIIEGRPCISTQHYDPPAASLCVRDMNCKLMFSNKPLRSSKSNWIYNDIDNLEDSEGNQLHWILFSVVRVEYTCILDQ